MNLTPEQKARVTGPLPGTSYSPCLQLHVGAMTTTTTTLAALRSGQLKGITRLDLACNLQEFPSEIFELADTLEILNLSGNSLAALPDDLSRLSKLRVLFCSGNRFTRLPEVMSSCVHLEKVGFKSNKL